MVRGSRNLCIEREHPLPDILVKGDGSISPQVAPSVPLCPPSGNTALSGHQPNQGGQMLCFTRGTTRNGSTAICSTMANPAEKGPPFPSGGINLASPGLHLWPLDWSLQTSPVG